MLSVGFLTGWRTNFLIWVTGSGVITSIFLQLYPTTLVQNSGNAQAIETAFTSVVVLGFLLCFPFVTENKAKQIAKKVADKTLATKFGTNFTVVMGVATLDNWTWHVSGTYTGAIVPFRVDVHSKSRKVIRLSGL